MFTSQLFAFIQSPTLGMSRCARLRNSRYASTGSAATRAVAAMNANSGDEPSVVVREVHAHRQHDDEVGRHHPDEQEPGLERPSRVGILERAHPPRGLDRLALHVALHRRGGQQPDEQVLDYVTDRSPVGGVAKRDAVAEHRDEGEGDEHARGRRDRHAGDEGR